MSGGGAGGGPPARPQGGQAVPGPAGDAPEAPKIAAVVFDWGGTLTPWHDVDLLSQWYAYAEVYDPPRARALAHDLLTAEHLRWGRQRDSAGAHGTGGLDELFAQVGVDVSADRHGRALDAYLAFWDPHTLADPDAAGLLRGLRGGGRRVGLLSNTMWPRYHHERVLARDGLLDLLDAAVFTSDTPTAKPHAEVFADVLDRLGVDDPASAVFVGDRLWDDVHGAQQAGMRAIHVPHSRIPLGPEAAGLEVVPDAVVERLGDVLAVVDAWDAGTRQAGAAGAG